MLGDIFKKALGVDDATKLAQEYASMTIRNFQPKELEEAKKAFSAICSYAERGSTQAQEDLASCYFGNRIWNGRFGCKIDLAAAVRWSREAAHKKSPNSCQNLSLCYYYGIGVEVDFVEALRWMAMAAELGRRDCVGCLNEIWTSCASLGGCLRDPGDPLGRKVERIFSKYGTSGNGSRNEDYPVWCLAQLHVKGLFKDDFYFKMIDEVKRF